MKNPDDESSPNTDIPIPTGHIPVRRFRLVVSQNRYYFTDYSVKSLTVDEAYPDSGPAPLVFTPLPLQYGQHLHYCSVDNVPCSGVSSTFTHSGQRGEVTQKLLQMKVHLFMLLVHPR